MMERAHRLTTLSLLLALASTPACSLFDKKGAHHKGGKGGAEKCDVDIDQWKARVKSFKDKKHQNKQAFTEAKDALARDLRKLNTKACKRELQREVSDLIDEVEKKAF